MAIITIREALNQAIREELARDENVFLMGEEVEDAFRFAEESPQPDAAELYTDVYANPIDPSRNRTR